MKRFAIILAVLCLGVSFAFAQNQMRICVNSTTGNNCVPVTSSAPFPITGSVTATNASIGATGSAVPASATYVGINVAGSLTGWTGAVTNAGTFAVQAAQSGTWNIGTLTTITNPVAVTQSGTWNIGTVTTVTGVTTVSTLTSLSQFAGNAINLGSGTVGTGTLRVTIASDSTGVLAVTQSTSPWVTRLNTTATIANGSGTVNAPSSESGAGLAATSSTALAANQVVKASAGNLYSFQVSADSTLYGADYWIMIYNATSAPSDGAVTPAKCYSVISGTRSFSAAFPTPLYLSTGITIGVSTTGCFTKTASTHAFISGDAQ